MAVFTKYWPSKTQKWPYTFKNGRIYGKMAVSIKLLAVFMSKKQLKLNALLLLEQETAPISLENLLQKLGSEYSERTLRRWLSEWKTTGIVTIIGQKRSTRYIATKNPASHTQDNAHTYFTHASLHALEQIKQPYALRSPMTYNPDWLQEYQPNIDFYMPLSVQEQLYTAGDRAKNNEPAGTYAHQIYQRLLIDLSYNSSRLEGNTYSLLETQQLVIEGIDSPGKLNEEKTMILNHKEAIRYLVDTPSTISINESTIFTLHYLLSDGLVATPYSGQLRDHGVRIGSSVYIPLENQSALDIYLKEICSKAAKIEHPYEQSLFLLIHIAYLQPFADVNKRTSRLSANIPLINNNLVPLSFNGISQQDYINAMIAVYELNDPRPLVDLYKYSYLRTTLQYDATVGAINFDLIRVTYRQQRREIIRYIITHQLDEKTALAYSTEEIKKFAKPDEIAHVLRNLQDDLRQLGPQSITGLGITNDQLKAWQNRNKADK